MFPGKIDLYKTLFRGREDIFAQRWEKGGKAGYSPQYDYDPYQYRLHKMKGGTIQNYADKQPRTLTDEQIAKHLSGEHFIGIYPLLKDNTSWFIVADFDKANWIEECRSFLTFCHDQGLPAYLERSRSGKGGHVWLFFERPYPAAKSRKIIIQRASVTLLDKLYEQILKTTGLQKDLRTQPTPETGKIKIELGQTVTITKSVLPLSLFNFLKDGLNFASSEYVIKKKLGKSTWGSERYFNIKNLRLLLPRKKTWASLLPRREQGKPSSG